MHVLGWETCFFVNIECGEAWLWISRPNPTAALSAVCIGRRSVADWRIWRSPIVQPIADKVMVAPSEEGRQNQTNLVALRANSV